MASKSSWKQKSLKKQHIINLIVKKKSSTLANKAKLTPEASSGQPLTWPALRRHLIKWCNREEVMVWPCQMRWRDKSQPACAAFSGKLTHTYFTSRTCVTTTDFGFFMAGADRHHPFCTSLWEPHFYQIRSCIFCYRWGWRCMLK